MSPGFPTFTRRHPTFRRVGKVSHAATLGPMGAGCGWDSWAGPRPRSWSGRFLAFSGTHLCWSEHIWATFQPKIDFKSMKSHLLIHNEESGCHAFMVKLCKTPIKWWEIHWWFFSSEWISHHFLTKHTMLRRLEARRAVAKPPGSQQGGHGTWGRRGSSLLYFSFFFKWYHL